MDTTGQATPTAKTETVRKIVQKLDQLPEQQARYIAAFALLLSRAARADLEISAEETALMERIVMQQSGLPEELADRFVGMYVNDLTCDYGEEGRQAVEELLERAQAIGAYDAPVRVEFVA